MKPPWTPNSQNAPRMRFQGAQFQARFGNGDNAGRMFMRMQSASTQDLTSSSTQQISEEIREETSTDELTGSTTRRIIRSRTTEQVTRSTNLSAGSSIRRRYLAMQIGRQARQAQMRNMQAQGQQTGQRMPFRYTIPVVRTSTGHLRSGVPLYQGRPRPVLIRYPAMMRPAMHMRMGAALFQRPTMRPGQGTTTNSSASSSTSPDLTGTPLVQSTPQAAMQTGTPLIRSEDAAVPQSGAPLIKPNISEAGALQEGAPLIQSDPETSKKAGVPLIQGAPLIKSDGDVPQATIVRTVAMRITTVEEIPENEMEVEETSMPSTSPEEELLTLPASEVDSEPPPPGTELIDTGQISEEVEEGEEFTQSQINDLLEESELDELEDVDEGEENIMASAIENGEIETIRQESDCWHTSYVSFPPLSKPPMPPADLIATPDLDSAEGISVNESAKEIVDAELSLAEAETVRSMDSPGNDLTTSHVDQSTSSPSPQHEDTDPTSHYHNQPLPPGTEPEPTPVLATPMETDTKSEPVVYSSSRDIDKDISSKIVDRTESVTSPRTSQSAVNTSAQNVTPHRTTVQGAPLIQSRIQHTVLRPQILIHRNPFMRPVIRSHVIRSPVIRSPVHRVVPMQRFPYTQQVAFQGTPIVQMSRHMPLQGRPLIHAPRTISTTAGTPIFRIQSPIPHSPMVQVRLPMGMPRVAMRPGIVRPAMFAQRLNRPQTVGQMAQMMAMQAAGQTRVFAQINRFSN